MARSLQAVPVIVWNFYDFATKLTKLFYERVLFPSLEGTAGNRLILIQAQMDFISWLEKPKESKILQNLKKDLKVSENLVIFFGRYI